MELVWFLANAEVQTNVGRGLLQADLIAVISVIAEIELLQIQNRFRRFVGFERVREWIIVSRTEN